MRTIGLYGVLVSFIVLNVFGCATKETEKTGIEKTSKVSSFETLKNLFNDPPAEYRSAPLWVWNNIVTEEEIDKQLEELHAAGIGGVFIHPRPGLETR